MLSQNLLKQQPGHGLVQGLVVVAALGRLDAAGAAHFAWALGYNVQGRLPKLLDYLETVFGYTHAAGMAVVNKDLRSTGIRMQRR